MLISELNFENCAPILAKSKIWNRRVASIKNLDLNLFLYCHRNKISAAIKEIQLLIKLVWHAILEGKCQITEIMYFNFPQQRMSIEDLRLWLTRIDSHTRRKALLFGLEMNLSSEAIVELEWHHLPKLSLTPFAKSLLQWHPRHFKLPYVFWEVSSGGKVIAPVLGLADDVWRATDGIGYDQLLKLYQDMVPIDSELDLTDFSLHIGQVAAGHC
ncbi:hypothetical protein [Aquitalea sp. USM4]|uniref:hypothetical protein n=1 Tax=Aquitalea sp. USM4 TaxID=1590041 RepID=UPI00103A4BE9|nr:hypothetical protein [Aquitalea sp. USM4]QBJ76918.1 hypothetical protein DKK66_01455 [Aquitalea sp. USM4]